MNTTTTKSLVTKHGNYEYVRTEQGVYGAQYVMRYEGCPTNGANRGSLHLLHPWCSRPDFFVMVRYGDEDVQSELTFRKNPETGKIEDVTDRMGGNEIVMDRSREATHGVMYYRSPRTFDGVAV